MKYLMMLVAVAALGCQQRDNGFEYVPNVLVIGDSVSIGYKPYLPYKVTHFENARTSGYTLSHLQEWLNDDQYDMIIWNNGIHDSVYSTYEEYEANILQIEAILKTHTNKLFFVTTTKGLNTYYNDRVNNLNNIAIHNLQINIIHLNQYTQQLSTNNWIDEVHFTEEASKGLANFIQQSIKGVIHDNQDKISL